MQRLLSGFSMGDSQVMPATGYRLASAPLLATSANAPAAITDFRSGKRARRIDARSTASLPSIRPQVVAADSKVLKLANFILCPRLARMAESGKMLAELLRQQGERSGI